MTWQVASVLVLTVALAIGFGWYEHSRPPARVLALVAALAALAAIGRVAFAAFPNVKPTSDIVLFSGYALGGAPGFAVGALAALVSNVFLGQGPWTPWQMASWGIVGLGGALFGKLMRGREPNRWLLAAVCGASGFLFGALMDMYQWTLAAEHTLSSYLAVSGTSLPFNVAHAVGNVVFALILGPAFIRALQRYRRRFEVRWIPTPRSAAASALLALAVIGAAMPARSHASGPPADVAPAIGRAVHYLRFSQNDDGGFGPARHASSTALHTGWTALGLAAAGRNPQDVSQHGNSIIDYVKAHDTSTDVGELERTLLVLGAAGLPPRLGTHNLLSELIAKQRRDGSVDTLNHTAFAVLAMRAVHRSARSREVRQATSYLLHAQNRDGGFGFAKRATSDVDDTGAVLQAIVAGGHRHSSVVDRAVAYLRKAQHADGGFGQMAGSDSNAQSTAFAVQGLVAAGRNPRAFKRTRNPLDYLKSLQAADGSVRYSRTSAQTPVWVTAQALDALEGKAFPLHAAPRQKARTVKAASAAKPPKVVHRPLARHEKPRPPRHLSHHHRRAPRSPQRVANEVHVTPVASTTTAATETTTTKKKNSAWPYVFAVVLGAGALAFIGLAWRRG